MLGLGWTEMLVVGVVALIVIGPKDLPVVMNRVGKFVGQIRRMGAEFQRELNKTTGLDEVRNLRQSITDPLRKTSEEIRREFNTMTPQGPKPSGLIKPADPQGESVVDEIKSAAGMDTQPAVAEAQPVKAATTPTQPAIVTAPPVQEPVGVEVPKPVRARKKAAVKSVPALPTEPSDSPAAPARKRRTKVEPAPTGDDTLATEPADSPAAPVPKPRRPRTPKPDDQPTSGTN